MSVLADERRLQLGADRQGEGTARGKATALRRIEEIDSSAVLNNPEVAGLKGRLYREKWERHREEADLRAALAPHARAFAYDALEYYWLAEYELA